MEDLPQKILVATDGSETAAQAVRAAVRLSDKIGSELHVVHVGDVPPAPYPDGGAVVTQEELVASAEPATREVLDEKVRRIRTAGGEVAGAHLRMGTPAEEIVGAAEELGTDMIVVGSRGLGTLKRMLVGSVSESVARHAPCPVLVVR
jgi:nucleotide-binding universal stress UspA family protein